jgi:DNA repair ATPase RecN
VVPSPTHTRIDALGPEERSAEIERMLGGEEFLAAIAAREGH